MPLSDRERAEGFQLSAYPAVVASDSERAGGVQRLPNLTVECSRPNATSIQNPVCSDHH